MNRKTSRTQKLTRENAREKERERTRRKRQRDVSPCACGVALHSKDTYRATEYVCSCVLSASDTERFVKVDNARNKSYAHVCQRNGAAC